ncbi:hypothetical protein IH992_04285 [Candidatus Poribacteria bacterium]|nr:hypothetical protein [Candidatus Poribacteria bacterium]
MKYLCPPDGFPDQLTYKPSPLAETFKAELFVPPIMQPVDRLDPLPDPQAHQLYDDFLPKKLYEIYEREFRWVYHPDPPYSNNGGSLSWGFWGKNSANQMSPMTPGPTYHARYGEPVLVRRFKICRR